MNLLAAARNRAAGGGGGGITANTKLLLHCDTDPTIDAMGHSIISSAFITTGKFSNGQNVNGSAIYTDIYSDLNPVGSSFDIDFWVYRNNSSSGHALLAIGKDTTGIVPLFDASLSTGRVLSITFYGNSGGTGYSSVALVPNTTWTWLSLSYDYTTKMIRIFIGGSIAISGKVGDLNTGVTGQVRVIAGITINGTAKLNGTIDEFRLDIGATSRVISDNLVPSSAAASGANTKLLMHFNGTPFTDDKGHTVTTTTESLSGNSAFGAYAVNVNNTSSRVPRVDAGSTTDFTLYQNSFTIELWFYRTSGTQLQSLFTVATATEEKFSVGVINQNIRLSYKTAGGTFTNDYSATIINGLYHWLAVSYDYSTDTFRIYLDGMFVAKKTSTGFVTVNETGASCYCFGGVSGVNPFQGYGDELRFDVGECRFTTETVGTTLTVPVAPYTA